MPWRMHEEEIPEELEKVDCREKMGQSRQAGTDDHPRRPVLMCGPQMNKRDMTGVGATLWSHSREEEGDVETKGRKVSDVSARLGTGLHGETLGQMGAM